MIRVTLPPAQRTELRTRHLGAHEQTVRRYVKAFLAAGFDALPDRPRPGRPTSPSSDGWPSCQRAGRGGCARV
jgi:hypothetical protein